MRVRHMTDGERNVLAIFGECPCKQNTPKTSIGEIAFLRNKIIVKVNNTGMYPE